MQPLQPEFLSANMNPESSRKIHVFYNHKRNDLHDFQFAAKNRLSLRLQVSVQSQRPSQSQVQVAKERRKGDRC
jgi:hypothetical protein